MSRGSRASGVMPGEAGQSLVVQRELPRPRCTVAFELVELDERDRSEHVGEVRLEAGCDLVVPRAVVTPGEAHRANGRGQVGVGSSRRGHPRPRRGSSSRRARSTSRRRSSRPCGPGRRSRVAWAASSTTGSPRASRDRGRRAGRRGRRAGSPWSARSRGSPTSSGSMLRSPGADVAEDRAGAAVLDHVRRRGPGGRRRDHLVAGSDAERDEREVHRGRAGGDGDRRARPRGRRRAAPRGAPPSDRSSASPTGASPRRPRSPPRRSPGAGSRAGSHAVAASTSKRTASAARRARSTASTRSPPTASTAPARSAPRRNGPKTQPGRAVGAHPGDARHPLSLGRAVGRDEPARRRDEEADARRHPAVDAAAPPVRPGTSGLPEGAGDRDLVEIDPGHRRDELGVVAPAEAGCDLHHLGAVAADPKLDVHRPLLDPEGAAGLLGDVRNRLGRFEARPDVRERDAERGRLRHDPVCDGEGVEGAVAVEGADHGHLRPVDELLDQDVAVPCFGPRDRECLRRGRPASRRASARADPAGRPP